MCCGVQPPKWLNFDHFGGYIVCFSQRKWLNLQRNLTTFTMQERFKLIGRFGHLVDGE